jgi:hypothetical protein
VTFEEQLELVSQVLADRSLASRPGPRRKRLQELGLPPDANIQQLMDLWRAEACRRQYASMQK